MMATVEAFTGITLAIGVATWVFSPIKFQADMDLLLTVMFLLNMLGTLTLIPAIAWVLKIGQMPQKLNNESSATIIGDNDVKAHS